MEKRTTNCHVVIGFGHVASGIFQFTFMVTKVFHEGRGWQAIWPLPRALGGYNSLVHVWYIIYLANSMALQWVYSSRGSYQVVICELRVVWLEMWTYQASTSSRLIPMASTRPKIHVWGYMLMAPQMRALLTMVPPWQTLEYPYRIWLSFPCLRHLQKYMNLVKGIEI